MDLQKPIVTSWRHASIFHTVYGKVFLGLSASCDMQFQLWPHCSQPCVCSWGLDPKTTSIYADDLMFYCYKTLICLHNWGNIYVHLCCVLCYCYMTETPCSVCFAGNFTVNSAGMEAAPPCRPAPIFSLSSFFLFIHMPLHHKPVQRASGSSWACGHNTERVPHQSSLHPARREERRAERRGGRREKIWDTFCFTHTPQICLCSWKTCSAHQWCCVENPSISALWPLHSHR